MTPPAPVSPSLSVKAKDYADILTTVPKCRQSTHGWWRLLSSDLDKAQDSLDNLPALGT